MNGTIEKKCNICGEWFLCTDEYFYNNSKSPDGLFPNCKECNRLKANKYRQENREECVERSLNWYYENREKELNRANKWNKENREYCRERFKIYIKTEKGKEVMNKNSKKRYSNKRHKITNKEWLSCKEYFKNENGEYCCAYCGITEKVHKEIYNQQLHKEHVDYEGSDDISNCVPSCKECNSKKHTTELLQWYNEGNPLFSQEKLDKINKWLSEDYKLYKEK